jgi:hypothetical protein
MRAALAVAVLLTACELAPSTRPGPRIAVTHVAPPRARAGYLRTADGDIPLEALFDPTSRDPAVLAFRQKHDVTSLTGHLDARATETVEPSLQADWE